MFLNTFISVPDSNNDGTVRSIVLKLRNFVIGSILVRTCNRNTRNVLDFGIYCLFCAHALLFTCSADGCQYVGTLISVQFY